MEGMTTGAMHLLGQEDSLVEGQVEYVIKVTVNTAFSIPAVAHVCSGLLLGKKIYHSMVR